jgi:hypothetical protein
LFPPLTAPAWSEVNPVSLVNSARRDQERCSEHIKIEVTSDFQSALRNSKSILADQQKVKNLQSGSQKSSETESAGKKLIETRNFRAGTLRLSFRGLLP